jgi:hypothetical protein
MSLGRAEKVCISISPSASIFVAQLRYAGAKVKQNPRFKPIF